MVGSHVGMLTGVVFSQGPGVLAVHLHVVWCSAVCLRHSSAHQHCYCISLQLSQVMAAKNVHTLFAGLNGLLHFSPQCVKLTSVMYYEYCAVLVEIIPFRPDSCLETHTTQNGMSIRKKLYMCV